MLLVLGWNHRTAAVAVRERLAVAGAALPAALASLQRQVGPGVLLSTCNRLEIYTLTPEPAGAAAEQTLRRQLQAFAADYFGVAAADLAPYRYHHSERDCVNHLFRVASGLDSMIVGEWEILGQVRAAFSAASEGGQARGPLSRLFHQALRVGRQAHRAAALELNLPGGQRRRSVSLAGAELAQRLLGDLSERQVLIIGAGAAGQLTGRALAAAGVGNLVFTNRTYDRAAQLSGELGGTAAPFEDLYETLAASDAVISATAAPDYLLRQEPVREVMAQRGGRPLLLIDIAVPRDIDPAVGLLAGVRLCDIDALRAAAAAGNAELAQAAAQAEELVAAETDQFMQWWASLDTISAIAALREYAERVRRAEVDKTLRRWQRERETAAVAGSDSGPAAEKADGMAELPELAAQLDALTAALVKKLLHHPTVYLRDAKDPARQQLILEIFNLDGEGNPRDRR